MWGGTEVLRCHPFFTSTLSKRAPRRLSNRIIRICSATSSPLSTPLGLMARRSGSRSTTALRFPLVPITSREGKNPWRLRPGLKQFARNCQTCQTFKRTMLLNLHPTQVVTSTTNREVSAQTKSGSVRWPVRLILQQTSYPSLQATSVSDICIAF